MGGVIWYINDKIGYYNDLIVYRDYVLLKSYGIVILEIIIGGFLGIYVLFYLLIF